jgi:PIN domain nuclease of toxin-antitoxin system
LNNLLLDTCGLIWLAQGGGELKKNTIKLIDSAKLVYISSISAWEISMLCYKKRISLPTSPEEWFTSIIESQDIKVIDLSPEIAFASNNLPWHHNDPADRFIIATATEYNLTIVTRDKEFKKYGIEVLR